MAPTTITVEYTVTQELGDKIEQRISEGQDYADLLGSKFESDDDATDHGVFKMRRVRPRKRPAGGYRVGDVVQVKTGKYGVMETTVRCLDDDGDIYVDMPNFFGPTFATPIEEV